MLTSWVKGVKFTCYFITLNIVFMFKKIVSWYIALFGSCVHCLWVKCGVYKMWTIFSTSWKTLCDVITWCLRSLLGFHRGRPLFWLKGRPMALAYYLHGKAVGIIACGTVAVCSLFVGRRYLGELQRLRDDLRSAEAENEQLQEKLQQLKAGEKSRASAHIARVNELTNKLSAEMSNKLSADESSVENVSIRNRPMNVADDFMNFCSNEWLTAKTELDEANVDGVEDVDKLQILFQLVMISELETKALHKSIVSDLEKKLYNPTGGIVHQPAIYHTENEYRPQKEGTSSDETYDSLPLPLTNAIGDFLRNQASHVPLDKLHGQVVKEFDQALSTTHPSSTSSLMSTLWITCKKAPALNEYIAASLRVCWKMVTQRPPMEFKAPTDYLGERFQDLYWKSEDPKRTTDLKVCHVFPMLYHGKSLMAKGKVCLLAA